MCIGECNNNTQSKYLTLCSKITPRTLANTYQGSVCFMQPKKPSRLST